VATTLRSPRLRRILIAYTVNRLGSWLGLVALSLAVFDHTHSALSVAGLLLAWQALPAFLVPAVVARVEASTRRSEPSGLYFFEGVVTAALALAVWRFSLAAVLVLAVLDGTAALAANALLRTAIGRLAREQAATTLAELDAPELGLADPSAAEPGLAEPGAAEEPSTAASRDDGEPALEAERGANAALNFAFSVSFVAGPVIGGAVATAAGVPVALLIDTATFLICGAALLDVRPSAEEAAGDSVRGRLEAAWAHVKRAPALKALLAADALALVFMQAGGPIEVAYVKATLNGGDRAYGLLVTAWGGGAILASIIFARMAKRPLWLTLSGGVGALGIAFLGFTLAPSLAPAYAAAFVGGAGNGLYVPSIISLVQRLTPESLHGRMIGAVESLGALSLAIALPLGGALVALSSPRTAFLILGVATLSVNAIYLRLAFKASAPSLVRAVTASATAGGGGHVAGFLGQEPPSILGQEPPPE